MSPGPMYISTRLLWVSPVVVMCSIHLIYEVDVKVKKLHQSAVLLQCISNIVAVEV